MRFDLAALARRQRNIRRRSVILRDIPPPAMFATNLYRSTYVEVVQLWQRSLDPILAEYERSVAPLMQDSSGDLLDLIGRAADEFNRLVLMLTPELRRWAFQVETWQRGKWRGAVLSATGVDLQTMIGPEGVSETLDTTIARNVALIKDVSAQAQGRISDIIFRGLRERRAVREVAAQLREAVAMSRRRSVNIAADQASKLATSLADERRREAGMQVWKWRHSGKLHPRIWHLERDGNLYGDTAAAREKKINGETVRKPPEDLPGQLPYCGCRSQGVLTFD